MKIQLHLQLQLLPPPLPWPRPHFPVVYVYDSAGAFTRFALDGSGAPATVVITLPPMPGQTLVQFVGDRTSALLSAGAVAAASDGEPGASVLLSRTAALAIVLSSTLPALPTPSACTSTEPCGWEVKACPSAVIGQVRGL